MVALFLSFLVFGSSESPSISQAFSFSSSKSSSPSSSSSSFESSSSFSWKSKEDIKHNTHQLYFVISLHVKVFPYIGIFVFWSVLSQYALWHSYKQIYNWKFGMYWITIHFFEVYSLLCVEHTYVYTFILYLSRVYEQSFSDVECSNKLLLILSNIYIKTLWIVKTTGKRMKYGKN